MCEPTAIGVVPKQFKLNKVFADYERCGEFDFAELNKDFGEDCKFPYLRNAARYSLCGPSHGYAVDMGFLDGNGPNPD